MATNNGILLSKSPYYISELGSAGFTSTIEIRIWSGAFASEPAQPTYTLDKQTLSASETYVSFEISKLVNDYFNHLPNPNDLSASDRTETVWVNVKSFNGSVNRDDTWLALDGYSNFLDGINHDFTGTVFISERILYHYDNLPLYLPVYVDGNDNANTVVFRLGASDVHIVDLTSFISSTNSYDKLQYVEASGFALGDFDNVVVKNSVGTILETLSIKTVNCTKYIPVEVQFINSFGVNQTLVFDLVSREKINVERNTFKRQTLEYTNGVPSYNTGKHVYQAYNSNVREELTLNTNYIDESLNDTLGELISSDAVWSKVDSITEPLNVKTNSLDYKKRVNEGLVNYTIQFDKSFNKRNTIY